MDFIGLIPSAYLLVDNFTDGGQTEGVPRSPSTKTANKRSEGKIGSGEKQISRSLGP